VLNAKDATLSAGRNNAIKNNSRFCKTLERIRHQERARGAARPRERSDRYRIVAFVA